VKEFSLIQDNLPTLQETLQRVPLSTGFNIEIKYAPPSEEKEYQIRLLERNQYVDLILKVVFDYAGARNIIFSSFDPDVCLMCSLKQPQYPILFLTTGGTKPYIEYDIRTHSLQQALFFLQEVIIYWVL